MISTDLKILYSFLSWMLIAHAYNPSYSGGRDQKDRGSNPAQANSSRDPISEKNTTKNWAGGVVQGVSPEFKLQYYQKKRKKIL
jgi:hypothetical protein